VAPRRAAAANRWNGGGAPLAANAQSAAFSPVHLLALALPLARAFTLIAAVHVLLAAAGTWLWARELGISPGASLVAAPAWALLVRDDAVAPVSRTRGCCASGPG
jgi:hypothetical protein